MAIICLYLHHKTERVEKLLKKDSMLDTVLTLIDKYDMYQAVRHFMANPIKDARRKFSASLVCDIEMQILSLCPPLLGDQLARRGWLQLEIFGSGGLRTGL